MLRDLVNEGKEVSLLISGSSMVPFIAHHRDSVYFKAPDRPLKKGDVVFHQRDNGQFVVHRILKVHDNGQLFDIIGDNQTVVEKNVRRDQIFGLIVAVRRKGKMIYPGDLWWVLFEKVWINMIPLRRAMLFIYSRTIGRFRKAGR